MSQKTTAIERGKLERAWYEALTSYLTVLLRPWANHLTSPRFRFFIWQITCFIGLNKTTYIKYQAHRKCLINGKTITPQTHHKPTSSLFVGSHGTLWMFQLLYGNKLPQNTMAYKQPRFYGLSSGSFAYCVGHPHAASFSWWVGCVRRSKVVALPTYPRLWQRWLEGRDLSLSTWSLIVPLSNPSFIYSGWLLTV